MKKHCRVILLMLLLWGTVQTSVASGSWSEIVYDREVPEQTRTNVQRAVAVTADLLTQYKIALHKTITIIVTSDSESYAQALMLYQKKTRPEVEETVKNSGGISLGSRPIILIKGTPRLQNSADEVFRVLPHEIFHQVQNQYGKTNTVNWLKEGTPEVFRLVAQEKAGFGSVADNIRRAEESIRRAATIPDTRQLAGSDYKVWSTMMAAYPIYPMAEVMAYRLIQDNGFENVVFFYQLLHGGSTPDKAFLTAFRAPMSFFLADMNEYFDKLRAKR